LHAEGFRVHAAKDIHLQKASPKSRKSSPTKLKAYHDLMLALGLGFRDLAITPGHYLQLPGASTSPLYIYRL
jgi:hypothetical protein